ncbi:MAG: hypothetical protein H7A45_18290 [Verrucomicrobiales bacterium]|nr:hypothetical protein [Verrucomicrobiales bacterium]
MQTVRVKGLFGMMTALWIGSICLVERPAQGAGLAVPAAVTVAASAATFIVSTASGVVSLVSNIVNYLGDYEEQETKVVILRYREIQTVHYRGISTLTMRDYWVDPNGESQYLTRTFHGIPVINSYVWLPDAEFSHPFHVLIESKAVGCWHSPDYWSSTAALTSLALGYDVVKSARLAQNCAPNPLPVTVFWKGGVFEGTCVDLPTHPYEKYEEHSASRRSYEGVDFPRVNVRVDQITLTPHIR